jgi:hypothetical protein
VKVSAGSSGKDRSIGKGERHGWELCRAHEMSKRGALESARMGEGVIEYNREGCKESSSSESSDSKAAKGLRWEKRDWFGVYSGGKKRKIGMTEGGGCVERSKGVYKNSWRWCGGGVFLAFLSVAFLV